MRRWDVWQRIGIMSAWMFAWILISSAVIALTLDLGWHFYVFGITFILAGIICSWAGGIQVKYGTDDMILLRRVFLISGTISAWAFIMFLSSFVIGEAVAEEEALKIMIGYSIFVNIILLLLTLFLPVYLFELKPGKYYLISHLGKPLHDFDIRFHPFERKPPQDKQNIKPGSLINHSKKTWIRAVDSAYMIWDSELKYRFEEPLPMVSMRDNYAIDLVLTALFKFNPQKIEKSAFALRLRKRSSRHGVETELHNVIKTKMGVTLRTFYYDKPFDRANSPKLVEELNKLIKKNIEVLAREHGLAFIDNTVSVRFAQDAKPKLLWEKDNTFMEQEHARFNQLTIDAYRGDEISRYELYHHFLQYPELIQEFLPGVNNVTLDNIDTLLNNMHYYPDYRDKVISKILQLNYYNSMLPSPPEQLGAGQIAPQIAAPLSDSQEIPVLEHPTFILSCTARHTVMVSWSKLVGEMYLHLDGQTSGPFMNPQDSHDTGRMSINQIGYTWQGSTYSIGNYSCQPSPPPPSEQEEVSQKKRRRYGPSGSAE